MIDEPPFITEEDMMGNLKTEKELKAVKDELHRRIAAYYAKKDGKPFKCTNCGHEVAFMGDMLGHLSAMPLIGLPAITHLCMVGDCVCDEPEV